MSVSKCFALILICSAVIGCGSNDGGPQLTDRLQPKRLLSLNENLTKAELSCANVKDCPAAVGLVVINDQDPDSADVRQCTGFLVDDDVVATSSQCIPNEVKADPNLCAERIGIKFLGAPNEEITCGKLLSATELTVSGQRNLTLPDVAFFSLSRKSTRKPLAISREGLDFTKPHTSFVITGTPGKNLVGKMEKRICTPSRGTDHVPSFITAVDDVAPVFGDDCEFQHSQLGSPFVNADGKVVGIAFDVPKELKSVKPATLPMPLALETFGLVTNLYCVDVPKEVDGVPKSAVPCTDEAKEKRRQDAKAKYKQDYYLATRRLLEKAHKQWLAQAPKLFRYQTTILLTFTTSVWSAAPKATGSTRPDIQCVRANEFDGYRKKFPGFSSKMYLPRFTIDQVYDAHLRRLPRITPVSGLPIPFTIEMNADEGRLEVTMENRKMNVTFCQPANEQVADSILIRTK